MSLSFYLDNLYNLNLARIMGGINAQFLGYVFNERAYITFFVKVTTFTTLKPSKV